MLTTLLHSAQKIRGFQHKRFEYWKGKLIWIMKRKAFQCPRWGSLKVWKECVRIRDQDSSIVLPSLPPSQYRLEFWSNLPLPDDCSWLAKRNCDSRRKRKGRFHAGWIIAAIAQEDVKSRWHGWICPMLPSVGWGRIFQRLESYSTTFTSSGRWMNGRDIFRRQYVKAESWLPWQRRSARNFSESSPIGTPSTEGAMYWPKASTTGFRRLIRQAYGFQDVFYLKLKIFQFSSIQPQKELWFMAQTGEEATISTNAKKFISSCRMAQRHRTLRRKAVLQREWYNWRKSNWLR